MIAVRISEKFVRITKVIPLCCNKQMLRIGEGKGRKRYYRCGVCGKTANGTTTKENLP